jgi:hypothetical protein
MQNKYGVASPQYRTEFKQFRSMCKRKKRNHDARTIDTLHNLSRDNPKEFWRVLRAGRVAPQPDADISMERWVRHFSELSTFSPDNEECIADDEGAYQSGRANNDISFDLPTYITREMIVQSIKRLKRHKASGIDGIKNEIIIYSSPYVIEILELLFNKMLKSSYFPEQWNLVMIVPLFKSGNQQDPNNFRGISLLSCLGKLFCLILYDCIYCKAEGAGMLSDLQGGYRRRRGCREQSFLFLSTLFSVKRQRGRHCYCAFVDFKKAYDSVCHSILWDRLTSLGLGPKLVRLLQSIYSKVKCSVRHGSKLSSFFNYIIGVRQGCVLSPLVFNLFIDELTKILEQGGGDLAGVRVGDLLIFTLLYCDDVVLIAGDPDHLQTLLHSLERFCASSSMCVNIKKTKIMAFFSRNRSFSFLFNNQPLDMVSEFKYLGCFFDSNLSFKFHVEAAVRRAEKASFSFFADIKNLRNMKISMKLSLYKTLVLPVLLYNVEVWGPLLTKSNLCKLERFHLSCLRRILMVGKKFSPVAVFWILGELDISTILLLKVVKFLFSIKNNTECTMFSSALSAITSFKNRFGDSLKSVCSNAGVVNTDILFGSEAVPPPLLFKSCRDRIVDDFWDRSCSLLCNNKRLTFMYKFCGSPGPYEFLDRSSCLTERRVITRFFGGSHYLRVEVGRWVGIPRELRLCRLCSSERLVEDEEHVLFHCVCFANERVTLLDAVTSEFPTEEDMSSAFTLLVPQSHVVGGNMIDANVRRKLLVCGQYRPRINAKLYSLIGKIMAKVDRAHSQNTDEFRSMANQIIL